MLKKLAFTRMRGWVRLNSSTSVTRNFPSYPPQAYQKRISTGSFAPEGAGLDVQPTTSRARHATPAASHRETRKTLVPAILMNTPPAVWKRLIQPKPASRSGGSGGKKGTRPTWHGRPAQGPGSGTVESCLPA